MESFFLAETVKYLYLLFDEDNFLHQTPISSPKPLHFSAIDDHCISGAGYVFNSEAHPLDSGLIHCCSIQRLRESEMVSSGEALPAEIGLHQDLSGLVNSSTLFTSLAATILNDLDVTLDEILSPSLTWMGGNNSLHQEMDKWVDNLWKDLGGKVLLHSATRDDNFRLPNYIPPNTHRKSAAPLMSCPAVSFHVHLNSMRDLDYRNLS